MGHLHFVIEREFRVILLLHLIALQGDEDGTCTPVHSPSHLARLAFTGQTLGGRKVEDLIFIMVTLVLD